MKWTIVEENVLRDLYRDTKISDLLTFLPGRTYNAINRKVQTLNLRADATKHKRRNNVRDDFFHIPNLINSYWAGFIAADGCIHKDKYSQWLEISIHKNDRKHLESFCSDIGYTGNIFQYENIVRITIYSKQIVSDLFNNFNITQKKSLTLQPPMNLSIDNIYAFIIGYIDGDGCIFIKDKKYIGLTVVGTFNILNFMILHFSQLVNLKTKYGQSHIRQATNCKTNITKQYSIVGKHALCLLQILEKYQVPKLRRKWDLVLDKKSF